MQSDENLSVCDGVASFLKKLANHEASYVIIGPMGYTSELGVVSQKTALDKASEEAEKDPRIRLYVRSKDFGSLPISLQ